MTATAPLRCDSCRRAISRRGQHHLIHGTFLLCSTCAAEPTVHRQLFFNCRESHGAGAHAGLVTTRGRARQIIQANTGPMTEAV